MPNKHSFVLPDIEQLFLRFLVGRSKIYVNDDYNDGLPQEEPEQEKVIEAQDNGWNKRILLSVEKERKMRVLEEKKLQQRREALFTYYFQQLLLTTVNEKLRDTQKVLSEHLQMHDNCIQLLTTLTTQESRYSLLAELLDRNPQVRNHVIGLVSNQDFMSLLGRDRRIVHDVATAVGMIGMNGLRYLIPALIFKHRINVFNNHNRLFTKKLWRYQLTLGQTCTFLMQQENYSRPYEGQILSAMLNFAYTASFQQYVVSFENVRSRCITEAREKGELMRYDFFYDMKSDLASLQSLLLAKSDSTMSIMLATEVFSKDFSHLLSALSEEVEGVDFESRSLLGKILFKAVHFAKYEQLRAARLFKREWLEGYLNMANIDKATFKHLSQQELFRFKPNW